jgi:hypothetical protein
LGERLRLPFPEELVLKPFQHYYRKAREGRVVHLDEGLYVDSVAAMRVDIASVTTYFPLSGVSPVSEPGEPLSPKESKLLQSSKTEVIDEAASMKVASKKTSLVKGFLQMGFLNSSLSGQASPKVFVASSSTLVVKEDEAVGAPFLGICATPTADKDEDLRVNDLIQSQNWPVSFVPSRKVVVWDQGNEVWDGEDGVSHFPLDIYPPDMPLDWAADGEEDEIPLLAILDVSVSK